MRVLTGLVLATALNSQTFDVASVKPNRLLDSNDSSHSSESSIDSRNVTLRNLIRRAWNVSDSQIAGGPAWVATDRWDVYAKTETPVERSAEGIEKMRAMMRALLTDRFRLAVHKEMKEMPAYAIVRAKGPLKLKPSAPDSPVTTNTGGGQLRGTKVTMTMLARMLAGQLGRTVIDDSGIAGEFDIDMTYAPEGVPDTERPSLFTVIQEQLGLKLESRRTPVEFVIIDNAERATEN